MSTYVPGGPVFNQKQKDAMAWPLHKLLLTSSEDLADAAAASLDKTTSYFTTGGSGETATLAAGSDGLVKIFSMIGDGGGNMVITVTNASWGGSTLLTFADVGDGCILIYAGSKWNLVGNNGVVAS